MAETHTRGSKPHTLSGVGTGWQCNDCSYYTPLAVNAIAHERGDRISVQKVAAAAEPSRGAPDAAKIRLPKTDEDESLLDSLRNPVDHGGYDGYGQDGLHIAAANRIEELRTWLTTEIEMHRAWRKRAEESESGHVVLLEALRQLTRITRMYVAEGIVAVDVAIMGAEAAIQQAERT